VGRVIESYAGPAGGWPLPRGCVPPRPPWLPPGDAPHRGTPSRAEPRVGGLPSRVAPRPPPATPPRAPARAPGDAPAAPGAGVWGVRGAAVRGYGTGPRGGAGAAGCSACCVYGAAGPSLVGGAGAGALPRFPPSRTYA